MTEESAHPKWLKMQAQAAEHLPRAFGSLSHAACYAALTLHPDSPSAMACCGEQHKILLRMVREGLTPFAEGDDDTQVQEWLDAHIERMDQAHPLTARYAELHAMRFRWLPARN